MQFRNILLAVTLALITASSAWAQSESTSVLDGIRKSKTIRVGIREASKPFSWFPEGSKVPSGYSVDICNYVIDHLRKELRMKDLAVTYTPVSSTTRMSKIIAREIDMECGQTVNTESRQQNADFSYAFFMAGEQFMSRKGAGITSLASLDGKTVAVTKGTTAEKLFSQLKSTDAKSMRLVTYPSNQESLKALEARKVDAFATIDIVLESMRLQSATPDDFVISKESISVEPCAIMLPQGDADFKKMVNAALRSLYASPTIQTYYTKWFLSNGFNVPMSRMLKESITAPSANVGVAMILGYSL